MAYDNNLTGVLFKNNKRENDRHPLYKGKCEINGQTLWISAWLKKSEKTGETYMSLSFKPAEEQRQPEQQQPATSYAQSTGRNDRQQKPAAGPSFEDDRIPFAPEVR